MSTVIICILLIAICCFSLKSYLKKINNGCCGSGGDEIKKIKPQDKNKDNYPYAFKINIEGMSCKNCKIRVENGFNEDGNFLAEVNLKEKTADVRSKKEVSEQELKEIVRKQGYKAVSITKL
ncbi:heavy-metal-associated domain-containing protein [uncultured Clostridium sp.]|uniref:heavy-metal-associated domain-containing protein n=1 Tax=uncultured Clostridium sp. TaxID=59620 RepID=UPI0025FBE5C1|nr:heavy metal-associated domain-containing protein [uncultured Clostridium sp.]